MKEKIHNSYSIAYANVSKMFKIYWFSKGKMEMVKEYFVGRSSKVWSYKENEKSTRIDDQAQKKKKL